MLDANILIYAHDADSRLHLRAKELLVELLSGDEAIGFAWITIIAFLRIITNVRAFPTGALRGDEAVAIVDSWLARPVAKVVDPALGHWSALRELTTRARVRANLFSDAHLAAIAIEHGATLITADRDFARFPNLKLEFFE